MCIIRGPSLKKELFLWFYAIVLYNFHAFLCHDQAEFMPNLWFSSLLYASFYEMFAPRNHIPDSNFKMFENSKVFEFQKSKFKNFPKVIYWEKVCLYNSINLWFSMTLNLDFMPFLWFYSQNCQFYDFLWFYARWDPCIIDSQKSVTIPWSKYLNESFKSMHDIQFNLSIQPCFWITLHLWLSNSHIHTRKA